MIENVWFYSV